MASFRDNSSKPKDRGMVLSMECSQSWLPTYQSIYYLKIRVTQVLYFHREFAKKHVKEERKKEREQIIKAWNIIDEKGDGQLHVDDLRLYYVISNIKAGVSWGFFDAKAENIECIWCPGSDASQNEPSWLVRLHAACELETPTKLHVW